MIKRLPKKFIEVVQSNDGLQRYLESLAQGRSFTPRSWLYESKTPDSVLDIWLERLRTLETGDAFEKEVYHFDTSQVAKWGPQGGIQPMSELLDDKVLPTFRKASLPFRPNKSQWQWALDKVTRLMLRNNVQNIHQRTYSRVVDDMRARDTLESNSGWPDFSRRNKPEIVKAALEACQTGEWIDFPAIALFRNYNQKTRLVWMFPLAANILEGSFMQPCQTAIMKHRATSDFYAPWVGFDEVRKLVTKAYDSGAYVYATDFSNTDEHMREAQISQVHRVLAPCFGSKKTAMEFGQSLLHQLQIPLVISPTEWVTGSHGVSSGSMWTNFVETVFDEVFGYYHSVKRSGNGVSGLYAIGDDMAWIADDYSDAFPAQIAEDGRDVGQEINQEKVTAKPDAVKTLQRLFQRGYRRPDGLLRGVYSTVRALKSSVYPERFHKPQLWSSDMFCARQYMILENCVDHPLFEEFVKFVVRGQKDLIPFARRNRSSLDRILRETKLLPGFNPSYNQEKRDTSLASFESIRIAKTL